VNSSPIPKFGNLGCDIDERQLDVCVDERQLQMKKGQIKKLHVGGTTSGSLDHLWPHVGAWNPIALM
jgi:hypothetical protein